ncbi:MAG TPA: hypothetical protein VK992_02470, partial [Candidatus Caenarcaniphilales bacterium]|nr:hypothetical protein [Candidatus Caenarcaniphilales bacterium]
RRLGRLRLKRIPQLHVKEDRTAERGTRVLRILDDLGSGRDPLELPERETLPTPGAEAAPTVGDIDEAES